IFGQTGSMANWRTCSTCRTELPKALLEQLRLRWRKRRLTAERKPNANLDAYDLYLRGLTALYQSDRLANEGGLRLFKDAIDLDLDFALAYARAASCYVALKELGCFSGQPEEIAEVSRIARRAIELGGDDAVVNAAAGWALGACCSGSRFSRKPN